MALSAISRPVGKHISCKHFLGLMRLIYAVFVILLVLMMPAQSGQNTEIITIKNSTILLFDASSSMSNNNKMDNAKIAVKDFVSGLDPISDEIALIVFYDCSKIVVKQPFTTNHSVFSYKVDTIRSSDSTPLSAAMDFAKKYIDQNANGTKKKIILFTDGEETCPYKATYNGSKDIEVSVIGFDIREGSDEESKLLDFAKIMGGNYLNAADASTPAALVNSLQRAYAGANKKQNLDYVSVWNNKGYALSSQGKYDEAIKAYDEAIRIDPKSFAAWTNKGDALNAQGKYDEAIKTYDEAIKLDPNIAIAWNNKGTALSNQGNYDEAIKAIDEAIRLDPKSAMAWNNKGTALSNQGNYDEAIKAIDVAIRLDPNLAIAWNSRGNVLNAQGKYDEAIKAIDEAVKLDSTNQKG
jgi:tetratricopeptide (TPR) repeat protein